MELTSSRQGLGEVRLEGEENSGVSAVSERGVGRQRAARTTAEPESMSVVAMTPLLGT